MAADRFAFGLFGHGLLPRKRKHFDGAGARNEANTGVVGEHDVARCHAHAPHDDCAVDFDRLDAPLAGA